MRLYHFTTDPIEYKPDYKYILRPVDYKYYKPVGLWLSDEQEYGWYDWCHDEDFRLHSLRHQYVVEVRNSTSLITLSNKKDFKAFSEHYAIREKGLMEGNIHWGKVMQEYGGILISPYRWEDRYDFQWYYGWDCASACIWDLSLIKSFQEVMK